MLCRQTEAQQPYTQLIDALSLNTKYVHDDVHVWLGNYSKLILCFLLLYVKTFAKISFKIIQIM